MKKSLVYAICILIMFPLVSLEVDRVELESAGSNDSIVFVNYEGPHDVINSIEEIKSIGSELGVIIEPDATVAQNIGETDRYYVIHAVDPNTSSGLDADILVLGENALVDHIDNVRRIIAGYLESAYGYTPENASTIAVFTTVYNAVYRGQQDVFNAKYKSVVTENLIAEKIGLSVDYRDWPGNTQIIIPLATLDGGLGTVDTTVISDDKVIESLREEPGMAVEERKDLVEIKEAEAEIAAENAQEAQQQVTEAKQELVQERQALEETQAEVAVAEQLAEENPDDEELQERLEEVRVQADELEQNVADIQEQITELEETAATQQALADTKQADAQSDRIAIAQDQQQIIRETAALDDTLVVTYGLKISDVNSALSTLVLIDTKTGITVQESPVNVIRNRTVYTDGDQYIAVAGTTERNAAVRLVKLDSLSMNIIAQSEEVLATDSVLVKDGDFYYVVIQSDNAYFVAEYDNNLNLILQSDVKVLPQTPIIISELGITVTNADGIATLLQASDLKAVGN